MSGFKKEDAMSDSKEEDAMSDFKEKGAACVNNYAQMLINIDKLNGKTFRASRYAGINDICSRRDISFINMKNREYVINNVRDQKLRSDSLELKRSRKLSDDRISSASVADFAYKIKSSYGYVPEFRSRYTSSDSMSECSDHLYDNALPSDKHEGEQLETKNVILKLTIENLNLHDRLYDDTLLKPAHKKRKKTQTNVIKCAYKRIDEYLSKIQQRSQSGVKSNNKH